MTLRATLKQWFSRGKKPTAAQFAEWIDSFWHKSEDTIEISDIHALPQTLNEKSDVGHKHTLADITDYTDEKEVVNCIAVDFIVDDIEDEVGMHIGIGKICAITGDSKAILRFEGADWTKLLDLYDGIQVICIRENAFDEKYNGEFRSIFATYDATKEEWVDASPDQDGIPSTAVIYMAEHYGTESNEADSRIYLFNDSIYAFQDVADPTGKYIQDGTIYVRNLTTALAGYTEKGMYNLCYTMRGVKRIGMPSTTKTMFYTFTVTASGSTVTQTLSNHDGYMTRSKVADGDWGYWDESEYSFEGHEHDIADIHNLQETLAGKADVGHNHDEVYQPAGNYAASNHNHDGVYQPAGNYAAADHTHSQYLTQHQDISHKQDKTDNSLLTTAKTVIGAINELWTKFKDYLKGVQHVTYAELVALRDNGELVPGQQYRITDFVTTTANDTEIRSAGHPYDIIMTADDASTLNEKTVRAAKHIGDTYFAKSNLAAWKLNYCLDNDIKRFDLADQENGKGVVYFMEDEFGNVGEFDFKNIQHKRYKVTDNSKDGVLGSLDGQYVGFYADMQDLIIEDYEDYIWAYPASLPSYSFNEESGELELDMENQNDATLNLLPEGTGLDADGGGYAHPVIFCKGNKFTTRQVAVAIDDGVWAYPKRVSDIVIFCYPKYFEGDDEIPARIEFDNSADNVFAPDSDYITMNGASARNTFLTAYSNIIFGGSVGRSIFKGQYSCCTFGGYINYATFGGYIVDTTFGGEIWYSTFGGYINYATFGGNIGDTTFGGYIERATFGGNIGDTTFGGNIWETTFGGYIVDTTFGGEIYRATFGGNLSNGHIHGRLYSVSIGSAGETWSNLVIDPGVEYVSVTCTESGDADIKNVHIFGGVCGTYDNPITVSIPTRNNALLEIKPTTKTEILV